MSPNVNWEEFSEIKHHVSQERIIICATILHLQKLFNGDTEVEKLITRLKKLDKRLKAFESYLVSIILKYEAEKE